MMRSSALSLALGYIALGIASLVLFAAPLWYAWQVTIQDGRSEILQADAQRLTDVYRRDGGDEAKQRQLRRPRSALSVAARWAGWSRGRITRSRWGWLLHSLSWAG